MPIEPTYDNDESMLFSADYMATNKGAALFAIRITNKGIYKLKTKFFAKTDPYYFTKIPSADVIQCMVVRRRQIGLYLLAAIMVGTGILVALAITDGAATNAKGIGYGLSCGIIGLIIPFVVRGRYILVVEGKSEGIKWVPPLVLDGKSKTAINEVFSGVIAASRKLNIETLDQRMA